MENNEEIINETMCRMMEISYIEMFGRKVEDNNYDLYPSDWNMIEDYSKKTDILIEAVKDQVKIEDTVGYQDVIEGVKKI